MNDDTLYLLHISECLQLIAEYMSVGRETFLTSKLVQDAVVRRLQTMAESSQRVSDELKSRHPDIDWRGLAGFRNVLVNNYLGIDAENVWHLVESKVPELRQHVEFILDEQRGTTNKQS